MANLPQQITIRQYLADGVTTSYSYPFLILLDSDISVYVTLSGNSPNPSADIQVLGVDYTVTGAGNINGGNVVFSVAPPIGSVVTLDRTMQISINTNFSLAQNFNGANLDDAFERVTLFCQQINTVLNQKALQFIINSYLPNVNSNQIPTLANGQVWSGLDGAIVATDIETNADTSLLRSQLASDAPLGSGSLLVGYYDPITGLPTDVGDFLDYKDVFGTDTGVADAMILTIANTNFSYKNGQNIHIIVSHNNLTTTPTLNVNGLGPVVIKRNPTSSAQASDLTAGAVVDLIYDSSANNFYITNLFIPTIASANPTFTTLTGSGTYNPPVGCTYMIVELVGGGGGSGGAVAGGSGTCSAGSGGGGGGYVRKMYTTPAFSYSYSVGTGGTAGAIGGDGGNGNDTSFGTLLGKGGKGGLGDPSPSSSIGIQGGDGGQATGGDLNINGQPGGYSTASSGRPIGGSGGSSFLGYGAAGQAASGTVSLNGVDGQLYGGGASGGITSSLVTSVLGGVGANGTIKITEYYS